jgi:hypothetical protein
MRMINMLIKDIKEAILECQLAYLELYLYDKEDSIQMNDWIEEQIYELNKELRYY